MISFFKKYIFISICLLFVSCFLLNPNRKLISSLSNDFPQLIELGPKFDNKYKITCWVMGFDMNADKDVDLEQWYVFKYIKDMSDQVDSSKFSYVIGKSEYPLYNKFFRMKYILYRIEEDYNLDGEIDIVEEKDDNGYWQTYYRSLE